MTAGLILFSMCNQWNNIFQTLMGLILFSTSTDWAIYGILARLGISTTYSTTVRQLHAMADSSKEFLKNLGLSPFDTTSHTLRYILIYDNVNKHQRTWLQRLSHQDRVQSGTSATIVILQNAPDEAFDLVVLTTNHARNKCSKLMTEALLDNIDFLKLCQAEVGQILGAMIKHIPPLLQHSTVLGEAYATKWAIHPIQPTRSQIHPLGTTSIDESKMEGNRDVLYDSFLTQIRLCKDNVQSTLFLVTGDQLSIQRLRTLIITTAKDVIGFSQHLWFVPLIVFWHMKWAFQ